MSRRKDVRYHQGTAPDPRYLQRIQEHEDLVEEEEDATYEPIELQPLRPRTEDRAQTRSFKKNEHHPIEELYSVVQPKPRFLSRMENPDVEHERPEFQIRALSRDIQNGHSDESMIHDSVYLPQIHASEDQVDVEPSFYDRPEISSLSQRVETHQAQARKPSLRHLDEV